MILLSAALVMGHPAGIAGRSPIAGQRVDLGVGPGHLDLVYVAETPTGVVVGDPDTIPGTISVTWNDVRVPIRWEAPETGAGDPGYTRTVLRGSATLDGATGDLHLRNDAFPGLPAFFYTAVEVSGDQVVEASSLARVVDGRLRGNQHGTWRQADDVRDTRLTLRPAGFWETAEVPAPLPDRMSGLASLGPPGWLGAAGAGLALGGIALGVRLRRSTRGGRAAAGRGIVRAAPPCS